MVALRRSRYPSMDTTNPSSGRVPQSQQSREDRLRRTREREGICTVSNTTGLGLNPSLCSTVWVQEGLTPLGNCGNMNTHLLMNTGKSMEVYVEVQIEVLAMPMVLEEDGHSLMLGHSNTVSRHFIHA